MRFWSLVPRPEILVAMSVLLVMFALGGCPSSDDDDNDSSTGDDDTGDDDTGDDDTGDDDTGDDDTGDDDDSAAAQGGISGIVTRSVEPVGDGVGSVVIMLFATDFTLGPPEGGPVGGVEIDNADMSDSSAQIAYSLSDIPVRPEPYFAAVFLDDNASGTMAGPDAGDLISQGNTGPAQLVLVDTAGVTEFDFDLNASF